MALDRLRTEQDRKDSSMQGTIPRERFPSERELWWSKTRRSQSKAMARPPPSTRPCKATKRKSISLKRRTARNKAKGAAWKRDSPRELALGLPPGQKCGPPPCNRRNCP